MRVVVKECLFLGRQDSRQNSTDMAEILIKRPLNVATNTSAYQVALIKGRPEFWFKY